MKRVPFSDILWLFLGTRFLLITGTYLSFILFPVPPHVYPSAPVDLAGLLTSWKHWDAERFVRVAVLGYQDNNDSPFFPLFPLLMKGVSWLLGDHFHLAAGMLISNAAFLGSLLIIYILANDNLGEQAGRRAVLYLCIFPTAFFFFTAYNESLFLLLTSGCFLALRRKKWWLAGLLAMFAGATRAAGVLLILPFLYEVWISRELPPDSQQRPAFFRQLLALFPKVWPVVFMPLGLLCYCLYCWYRFSDPLAFATAQINWARVTAFPWSGLFNAFFQLFHGQAFGSFQEAHILIDLTATLGAIALTVVCWRRLRTSYAIWITLLVLFMLTSPALGQPDALQSNQRFLLEMFPLFLALAALGLRYRRLHYVCLLAFPFLQAIMAALFVLNRWMV